MKSIRMSAVAAAFVIAAGMIGGANAEDQPAQSQSNGSGMGHGGMDHGGMAPGMMDHMGPGMMGHGATGPGIMGGPAMCSAKAGHVEGLLAYAKAELKITEAQEPLWNSYASAARDNAGGMRAHCADMMSKHGTSAVSLPDPLDQQEQSMETHFEAIRAMNRALKALYAALSDSQKQTADELFWSMM